MDYYNTSYGAQGGADGGGFVGGDVQSSPAGGKSSYEKDAVRPLTVKQILDAQLPHPDADFKVDGVVITQVTFVGQVLGINPQTTNITYKIDDGTGMIEVKQWIDAEANQDQMDTDSKSKVVENGYCRVYGRLKSFNNKRHVGAHVIRPITDYNEINYHLLEATAVHLYFTRGPPQTTQANGTKENGAGHEEATNGRGEPRMSPNARKVFNELKGSPQNNEGLHVQMLASQLGMGVNDVYKAAEELVSNGLIFTTVDDNTWAVLDY